MNFTPGRAQRFRHPLVFLSGVIVFVCALMAVRNDFARILFLPVFLLNVALQLLLLKTFAEQETSDIAAATALDEYLKRNQRLEERNHTLENAIGKLEEVERLKKNFLLTASHQMRSPLVAIQSVIRAVVSDAVTGDPEASRALLQQAYNRSEDMLGMVNDILTLAEAKVEQETGREQSIPADELNAVVSFLSPQAAERNVTLQADIRPDLPTLPVARKSLSHIFTNLIENALKYSPDNSTVRILLAPDPDGIVFEVADSGIGIPLSEQPKIFKEFFRADNARALRSQGTGLGLAIVHSVIQNLGGDISFVSSEGQGTTFTVRLPRIPAPDNNKE